MGSFAELRRFAEKHGTLLRSTKHEFYLINHPVTGETLLLKISFGKGEVPPNLWKRILRQQLTLPQEEFNLYK